MSSAPSLLTPAPQIRRVSRRHCALYKLNLLTYLFKKNIYVFANVMYIVRGQQRLASPNIYQWTTYQAAMPDAAAHVPGRHLMHSPDDITFVNEMMSWPPCQSLYIYMNNPAKFHPDVIWNDRAFSKTIAPIRTTTSSDMGSCRINAWSKRSKNGHNCDTLYSLRLVHDYNNYNSYTGSCITQQLTL